MDSGAFELLGPSAAETLAVWERQTGRTLGPFAPMDAGGSGALLVLAYVRDGDARQRKRRMIIKLCADDGQSEMEPGNHIAALRSRPRGNESFPEEHLVRQMYDPQRTGRSWLMFQEIAGRGDWDMTTLAALLRSRGLPEAVAAVTRSLLTDWNLDEHGGKPMTACGFVAELLDRRLQPGTPLNLWSQELLGPPRIPVAWLRFPDGRTLPNPLDLSDSSPLAKTKLAYPVRGRAHGDLHPGNIMVPKTGQAWQQYALIDLSRFSDNALLTRDPVHLLLHVVSDFLPPLGDGARTELLDLLVGNETPALEVPHGVHQTLDLVDKAPREWLSEHDIKPDWASQWLLALQACALMFTAREQHTLRDRWWFYRLAAEAAGAYLRSIGRYEPGRATAVQEPNRAVKYPDRPAREGAAKEVTGHATVRSSVATGPEPMLLVDGLHEIIRDFEPYVPGIIQEPVAEVLMDQADFIANRAASMRERLSEALSQRSPGPSDGNGWNVSQVLGHLRATKARAEELTAELGTSLPSSRPGIAQRKLLEAMEDLLDTVRDILDEA
ncbi:hypothetical protein [Streptomyces sp. NPDC059272]|uniref:hypothetical protein n=1 Tax=Streptomyces sp. NPDC059272 TaxID=3346800 RepID=UPI00368544E4